MKKLYLLTSVILLCLSANAQRYYPAMYQPAQTSPVQELMLISKESKTPSQRQPIDGRDRVKIKDAIDTYTINGKYPDFAYYIVVGSFNHSDNAKKSCHSLEKRGIHASIAVGNKGISRVVLDNASNDEQVIRNTLISIRLQFPDAWILKINK